MLQSPPSWRRGLKYGILDTNEGYKGVASFLEAWIEIQCSCIDRAEVFVASFLETWIEII